MIIRIGIVAGEIWRLLEKEDKLPLSVILSKIGKDIAEGEDVVCMGSRVACQRRPYYSGEKRFGLYSISKEAFFRIKFR